MAQLREYINTTLIFGGAAASVTGEPIPARLFSGMSFQNRWNEDATATLAATITIEGTNTPGDPSDPGYAASATWTDITTIVGPIVSPTAGVGNDFLFIADPWLVAMRMKVVSSVGTGLVVVNGFFQERNTR